MALPLGWAVAVAAVGAIVSMFSGESMMQDSWRSAPSPSQLCRRRSPPAAHHRRPPLLQATSTLRRAPASAWSPSSPPRWWGRSWRCARSATPSATTWRSRSRAARWCSPCTARPAWANPCSTTWRRRPCTTGASTTRCAARGWIARDTKWGLAGLLLGWAEFGSGGVRLGHGTG